MLTFEHMYSFVHLILMEHTLLFLVCLKWSYPRCDVLDGGVKFVVLIGKSGYGITPPCRHGNEAGQGFRKAEMKL